MIRSILIFGLSILLLSCDKHKEAIEDLSGTWEFTFFYPAPDSILSNQPGVITLNPDKTGDIIAFQNLGGPSFFVTGPLTWDTNEDKKLFIETGDIIISMDLAEDNPGFPIGPTPRYKWVEPFGNSGQWEMWFH